MAEGKTCLLYTSPEAKFETVVVQPSEYQKDMVASLSERAADVHAGIVDPSVDNMLKITSDGRKLGLDQRLMNTLLPDDPDSKLNACVGNCLLYTSHLHWRLSIGTITKSSSSTSLPTASSVSYTHLDVYKRQTSTSLSGIFGKPIKRTVRVHPRPLLPMN